MPDLDFEAAAKACLNGAGPVDIGIVLGSGLAVLDDLEDRRDVPFSDIPGFPQPTVEGHQGVFSLGRVPGGRRVAIARGRFHLYEGHSDRSATYVARMIAALGAHTIVLTNAAGGLREDWAPGDLMLISDHLNFTTKSVIMPGERPQGGVLYDLELQALALGHSSRLGLPLQHGCYVGLLGPSYETAAEIRYLVGAGADAVGMSTVLEATSAHACGLRVLGISCITNVAVTAVGLAKTSHGEVVDVARKASGKLDLLLRALCGVT